MRAMTARKITLASLVCVASLAAQRGPQAPQGPPVSVTVNGKTWTQQELFQRNIGARDDQTTAFPPHKVIGNIYYVGTKSLSSYLITTPQGHILVNSTYERNVPIIQKSVEDLGFKFSDVKILLGSHAHGDHQEGDALLKQLTGAQVVAMAEDVPALEAMKPGGKPHPIDRVIHDGDTVTLGGVTLTAHLTPGHTRGCTTWTMKVADGGKSYDVVIMGSVGVNPGFKLVNNPDIPHQADEYRRAFQVSRALPCDVPLASHGAMYNLAEKYARMTAGGPNPFIDPAGYKAELDLDEAMFKAVLAAQEREASSNPELGTWQLNLAKSTFRPGPAPTRETRTYESAGDGVKFTQRGVAADGRQTLVEFTARYDGKSYPLTGSPSVDSVAFTLVDGHRVDAVETKDGKKIFDIQRVISADGRTMTVTSKGTTLQGRAIDNVMVFDKQ